MAAVTLHDELRAIALAEFATSGYAATSLQRIADLAGTSKASVLYHFASKELLLADIVSPAVDDLDRLLDSIDTASGLRHADFVESFVDLLLRHREVVPLVINQGATLDDVPVMHRATEIMRRVAELFRLASGSTPFAMCLQCVWLHGQKQVLASRHTAVFVARPFLKLSTKLKFS